jgi:hypothetical protein
MIVDMYVNMVSQMYQQMHPNVDPMRVKELVSTLVENHFEDIPVKMDNNIRHETFETTMTQVFDWMETRKPIISSNGTFFKQHSEYLSPTVLFLETLQKDRKATKKEMYTYPKGSIMYLNLYCAQGQIKVIMNSDYGGSGTPLSPFYSLYIPPATTGSAKNMTTTLICCLELLSGNKDSWARLNGINELFDFIKIVLTTDTSNRTLLVPDDRYSVDEVVQHLIDMTTNINLADIRYLKQYVGTLSSQLRTKLMLANNIRLVLKKYLRGNIANIMSYLKKHRLNVDNITQENIDESGYGVKPPKEILNDLEYCKQFVLDNCVYPFIPNDCETRAWNMHRDVVCVTDTDSLMVHFASYLDEFQAHVDSYRDSCLIASAFGFRLFIEAIIPQMTENIVMYRNIQDKYYRDKFVFKNEFAFLAMSLFAKKMYSASCFVQEGNPRNIHETSVTGLSFKKRDSAEFLEPIMLRIHDQYILTPDKIDVKGMLDEYYALRDKLKGVVKYDPHYHKAQSTKAIDAYKTLPAHMKGMIIWNNMFPEEAILPMDRITMIPLSWKLLEENRHIPELAKIIRFAEIDNPKHKTEPVISLPESYHTIPEWLQPAIDADYCVDKLLSPFKQALGLFDVVINETHGGMIPSRMVFL